MFIPRVLGTVCLVGMTVSSSSLELVQVHAAASSPRAVTRQPEVLSRTLLDRYCVTCHNERLKTGGVMFDQVDIGRVDAHRELFENVVRKLRSGQMPPQGLPRPDDATVLAFVAALEAELDRVGAPRR